MSEQEQGYILLIPGWVDRICTPTEARVYGLINAFSQINNNGYCWLSVSGIAERLETAERHVKAALSSLKARGMISREASEGGRFITTPIPRGVTKPVPPRVTDSGSGGDGFRSEGVTDSVPQYKDLDKEDIKNESESPPAPPEPDDPLVLEARKHLDTPDGSKRWERSSEFIGAGRRPLKKYPKIFITEFELARVFRQYLDLGLPQERWPDAFQAVQSKLDTPRPNTGPICAFNWLTSFTVIDLMRKVSASAYMKKAVAK